MCNAKRRRQRERWKNNNRSNYPKKQICTCSTLWTFLCCCFARLQSEIPRNFLVTRFMEEMSNVFLFTLFFFFFFFFTGAHFYLGGRLAFLIFSPLLQNFHVFLPIKKCLPLFSLSRSSSLSLFFSLGSADLSPTFSFSLCFSLSIFQICGQDLNTLHAFRFRRYWLFSCLCLTRRGWLCDFPPK